MRPIPRAHPRFVTPFTGVWIEILYWEDVIKTLGVTPFTGVWIEIVTVGYGSGLNVVTPFTGVWIEILWVWGRNGSKICHTLHGCVD